MKLLNSFLRRFYSQEYRVLGRWNLETSIHAINNKVDLANNDHCGVCYEYGKMKIITASQEQRNTDEEDEYIRYMM